MLVIMASQWLVPVSACILIVLTLPAPNALCDAMTVNCSEPSQPALLTALTPIFTLKTVRPVMNMSTCTDVYISFIMYGILGVDEKAQLLNTYLWINYAWRNEFVSWDPTQCGNDRIALPRDKFWMPDIVINEFMDENTAPSVPYVYVFSDGRVLDAQPARVVSSCNLDIYNFPFDIQTCTLTFNSYIHLINDIKIFLSKPVDHMIEHSKEVMTTMGEWELLDMTAQKNNIDKNDLDYIDELEFHIVLKRRSTLYVVNLLVPSCFLITVDLFSFLLPPQTVDRSSFKMTLILGYTVFLLLMNDLLPVTGNKIPLINVFFSLCLALMVSSLLETILITNLLCGSAKVTPVPRWVRVLVLQILGCLVCLPYRAGDSAAAAVTKRAADAAPPEKQGPPEEPGPAAVEDEAVQQLQSLGRDVQALRLQAEKQLGGGQGSEEWMQCSSLKAKPSKLLFVYTFLLLNAGCSCLALNCSQPNTLSLLEALTPVFKLNSIRPVVNSSTPTNIDIGFVLFGILGVDEKAQILKTYIWQTLIWRNEFISWDPEQCGSAQISLPRTQLWVPDMVINEFMEKNSAPFAPYTYVYHDGVVMDEMPVRVISACRLDIYMFPFDVQNCSYSFNSYLYRVPSVQVHQSLSAEEIFHWSKTIITTMGEWELVGITSQKFEFPTQSEETYQELRFHIVVKRRPTMYVVNMLLPSCFLVTIDLFSFMLPPQSVDRSLFKMTLILGYTMLLLNMNDMLPITGDNIPLIDVFLSLCLGLMVVSLLETIFITNLLRGSAHYTPVPRWLRLIVLRILGPLVGLRTKSKNPPDDTVIENPAAHAEIQASIRVKEGGQGPGTKGPLNQVKTLEELKSLGSELHALRQYVETTLVENQSTNEWVQVGFIIDRLLFVLYVVFLSVSFITIIILWVELHNTV